MVIFSETVTNYNHRKARNPETNPGMWYVNERFLIIMECYAFLETFRKGLFNDDIFGNVD